MILTWFPPLSRTTRPGVICGSWRSSWVIATWPTSLTTNGGRNTAWSAGSRRGTWWDRKVWTRNILSASSEKRTPTTRLNRNPSPVTLFPAGAPDWPWMELNSSNLTLFKLICFGLKILRLFEFDSHFSRSGFLHSPATSLYFFPHCFSLSSCCFRIASLSLSLSLSFSLSLYLFVSFNCVLNLVDNLLL